MSVQEREATAILTALPEGLFLGEMLFYSGVRTLADTPDDTQARLTRVVEELAKSATNAEHFPRIEAARPSIESIEIEVTPKHGLIGWEQPLILNLHAAVWQEAERHFIAYLPVLGIEVVASSQDELRERIVSHARLLLNRMRLSHDLQAWARMAYPSGVEVLPGRHRVESLTPLQLAKRHADQEQDKQGRSELERSASDLSRLKLDTAYEIDPLINRLGEALTAKHRRPVLLVGPSGVGKTAAVHEFVRQRQRFGLGKRVVWQTDGPRLVAGMTGFGMWQQRCTLIIEEARRTDAILFLGNLVQLMQVGQHEGNEQGIASFFKPYLTRGEIQVIAECTDEQRKLIEVQDPNLLSAFEELPVVEPDRAGRKRILKAVADEHAKEARVTIGPDAIGRIDDLHQRFATYSVAPGRPVRFLKNLARSTPKRGTIGPAEVTGAFTRETGLPLFMIDENVPFEPDQTRSWFTSRVIGQDEAVSRVVDLLTVVKANLSRPSRPIGSLLFIGPTGVGKTQMAKSLAEYLFGDADRMTRFDMSEYSDEGSVTRLTQAPITSGGATLCGEGLLTAKVREQPFGVLLFDEFEKAHPAFFDLLLQVLGEGRLTDSAGRLADFTNSVIIMTSNLGAQAFQTDRFGFATTAGASQTEHFVEAVRDAMRPELFNRIDRIVPFNALGREQVRSIVERELDQVRKRDGLLLRSIEFEAEDPAIDLLASIGFDAKLGARPLQRAIERRVLAPLADQINRYGRDTALRAIVSVEQSELSVRVQALDGGKEGVARVSVSRSPVAPSLRLVTDLRRKAQLLVSCSSVVELRNETERLRRIQQHRAMSKRTDAWTDPELQQLPRMEAMLQQIEDCRSEIEAAEDDLATRLYAGSAGSPSASELSASVREAWRRTVLDVYCRRFRSADELLVAVYSDIPVRILPLIEAYRTAASEEGALVEYATLFTWNVGTDDKPKDCTIVREANMTAESRLIAQLLDQDSKTGKKFVMRSKMKPLNSTMSTMPRSRVFGVLLRVRGPHIPALFSAESGIHRFRGKSNDAGSMCYVHTSGQTAGQYQPPDSIETQVESACEGLPVRRTYDTKSSTTEDKILKRRTGWSLERCALILPELIRASREKTLEGMIEA